MVRNGSRYYVGGIIMDESHIALERFSEIMIKQDQFETKLISVEDKVDAATLQLHELAVKIDSFVDSQEEFTRVLKRAFPKDENGDPDYDGHRSAHLSWIKNAPEEKEILQFMKRFMKKLEEDEAKWTRVWSNVISSAILAILGFTALAVWITFLKGPKG